jgi:hypothetical protein
MAKWADLLISAVIYNEERTHIERVRVHEDDEVNVGAPVNSSRLTVVSNIKSRYSYVTIYKTTENKWKKGEDVRIIKVGNEEFIRTDANQTAADNLGDLPEYC